MSRIQKTFAELASQNKKGLIPFFTAGDPSPELTVPLMHAMVAADILVLPSYREGFGTVVIEAAACGVPAVVSRIYGLTDAVDENVTGLMHLAGDVPGLVDCLQRLCDDGDLRQKMGAAACARAQAQFSMVEVTAGLVAYYEDIFKSDYRHHQKSFL